MSQSSQNEREDKMLAVMQPYLFPYIGYYQLVQAADVFVFYDDVDFIKQGWINRNKILINGDPHVFTVPCHNASSNETIHDVIVHENWRDDKLLKKIRLSYTNANAFDTVFPMIEETILQDWRKISALAQESVKRVAGYLNIDVDFYQSSDLPIDASLGRADRLIELTKHFGGASYINMEGGKDLYDKTYFSEHGVKLQFLKARFPGYNQHHADTFHPGLSIIDVLMNVSKEDIRPMLNSCQLT